MKQRLKIVTDAALEMLFFALMCSQFTEQACHEILGAVMFAVFVLHHVLNFGFYKTMFKGKYTARRTLTLVVDTLLLFDMLALTLSGMAMSRYVFRLLNFVMSAALARQTHMAASFSGFLLAGLHLGLHVQTLGAGLKTAFRLKSVSRPAALTLKILCLCVSGWGLYAAIKRGFFSYITLRRQFLSYDPAGPAVVYLIDLFAVTFFAAMIGYQCVRLVSISGKQD